MDEQQGQAYEEYLGITGEKDKRKEKRKPGNQINIRLNDSDYAKLEKLAEISQESLKLSFKVGDSVVDLNEVVPTSWQTITPTRMARHLIRKAIQDLLPDE